MTRALAAAVIVLALAAAGCAVGARAGTDDAPLLVGAASDLLPAFEEIGASFTEQTGERVTFSFGSSGQLAQQIIEGAPMDVFASADVAFVEQVLESGRGLEATQATYAFGQLAVWSRQDAWGGWETLEDVADDPEVDTIAIANPTHAPYGRAAQQALERSGVWEDLGGRLVYGENVSDTQRLAASGNADASVVALSLAMAADERGRDQGSWVLIDDALHAPLQQDLAVVAEDPRRAARASRFIAFVNSEEGRGVMRRFGFLLPDEAAVAPVGR